MNENAERDAFSRLITSAKMLLQNAVGCAVNHYGEDYSTHGEPGWIADCRADIVRAAGVMQSRAALTPPPVQGEVKVKPLEWDPFRAQTAFGYYFIDDQSDRSSVELDGRLPFLLSGSRLDLSRHARLTDARAAAQADYEQRIRSALIEAAPAPACVNVVEEIARRENNLRAGYSEICGLARQILDIVARGALDADLSKQEG
jgi:hypothetical protein